MKVLFDTQCFDAQKFGGISRYFCEIMKNFPACDEFILPCIYSRNEYLKQSNLINCLEDDTTFESFLPNFDFFGKEHLFWLRSKLLPTKAKINRKECIKALQSQDFDVFHPTYYDTYFLEYIGKKPFVLTVHDMIHERYPKFFRNSGKIIKNKKLLAEKAAKIIAVSNKTKEDIVEFYGASFADKTEVVYHGSSLKKTDFTNGTVDYKSNFGKYFLYTGARNHYKNFLFFIESCADLLKERNLKIICTGTPFSKQEISCFKALNITDLIVHCFASDNELFWLYKHALAFVFPSYYEGFGIPILEAFEAGTPCLLAKASCFPEIAKEAALYFDPQNKNEIVSAMSKILDKDLAEELVEKGKKRLTNFSWKKTAEKTTKIYKSIIGSTLDHQKNIAK